MFVIGTSAVGIKIKIFVGLIQILFELGQLARAIKAGRVDHERRVDLAIAVLQGLMVGHEVEERALKPSPPAGVQGKAAARNL